MSSDCGKLETDVELKISAAKFHELYTKKTPHLTTASSDKVKECELHEGEWGAVGSVVNWNYVHDGKPQVVKHVLEAIDDEKNSVTLRLVEGDLMEHYKSFRISMQASPKGDEGCNVHWIFEYEKVHGDVEDPHTLLQLAHDISKDICSHHRSTTVA